MSDEVLLKSEMLDVDTLDIAKLLQPIQASDPCGEDCHTFDFDPEYTSLSNQFVWQELTDEDPFKGIKWSETVQACETLFGRCKSFRIINVWLLALIKRAGFEGLRGGLTLALGLIEQYWDNFEPLLEDEEGDPMPIREFILKEVSGPLLMKMLGSVQIWDAKGLGQVTVSNLLKVVQEKANSGAPSAPERNNQKSNGQKPEDASGKGSLLTWETLQVIFQPDQARMNEVQLEAYQAQVETIQAILTSLEKNQAILDALSKAVTDKSFSAEPFELLKDKLKAVSTALILVMPEQTDQLALGPGVDGETGGTGDAMADSEQGVTVGGANAMGSVKNTGKIENRQQVIQSIERIIDYYRRCEPSSPVPILLGRAKNWVDMDFLSLIKDLTPDSLKQAETVLKMENAE